MVLYFDEGRKVRKMGILTGCADFREGRDCFPDDEVDRLKSIVNTYVFETLYAILRPIYDQFGMIFI